MIEVRPANATDAPELKRLNDLFNGAGSNTLELVEESLKRNEHEIVLVAADGNMLVGFCCGQIFVSMCYPSKYCEITELFVQEEYRRRGIGRRLLQSMENELRERGATHFHVLTFQGNTSAQALYHSHGYNTTSEILLDKDLSQ